MTSNRCSWGVGCIVRLRETWGVVIVNDLPPVVDWLTPDGWRRKRWYESDISASFAHSYEGIPDHVLARATMFKLTGD